MLDFLDFKAAIVASCQNMLDDANAIAETRSDCGIDEGRCNSAIDEGLSDSGTEEAIEIIAESGTPKDPHAQISIEERIVTKAQRGKLCGLIFKAPGSVCAPTFYVEDLYDMYRGGCTVEELAFAMSQYAIECNAAPPSFPGIDDLDGVCPDKLDAHTDLGVRLINLTSNNDYLKNIPHLDNSGLALIAEMRSGEYRAVIDNEIMDSLGLTGDSLFEAALKHSASADRATLFELSEMFLSSFESNDNLLDSPDGTVLPPGSLYVLSNERCFWGAAALFYPGMLGRLNELMGGPFYVLPSSVHEVLLLSVSEGDPMKLAEIIRAANCTVTSREDYLSDDLFMCESGNLCRVCPA